MRVIKYLLMTIISIYFILNLNNSVFAQSPSPTVKAKTATPTVGVSEEVIDKLKQIEQLKEKIATKVAEIRDKDKKGAYGTVSKIEKDSLTLQGKKGETVVTYSDDTVFYSLSAGEKKELTAKNISVGDTISVLGYLTDDKAKITAKYIYLHPTYLHTTGKIVDIDKDNYTITIKEKQGNQVVDIETSTKINLYVKGKDWQKGGFSKFKLGDYIHAIGTPNAKDKNKITGLRVYVVPGPVTAVKTSPSPEPSGKKISPTEKISPTVIPSKKG